MVGISWSESVGRNRSSGPVSHPAPRASSGSGEGRAADRVGTFGPAALPMQTRHWYRSPGNRRVVLTESFGGGAGRSVSTTGAGPHGPAPERFRARPSMAGPPACRYPKNPSRRALASRSAASSKFDRLLSDPLAAGDPRSRLMPQSYHIGSRGPMRTRTAGRTCRGGSGGNLRGNRSARSPVRRWSVEAFADSRWRWGTPRNPDRAGSPATVGSLGERAVGRPARRRRGSGVWQEEWKVGLLGRDRLAGPALGEGRRRGSGHRWGSDVRTIVISDRVRYSSPQRWASGLSARSIRLGGGSSRTPSRGIQASTTRSSTMMATTGSQGQLS